MKRTTRRLAGSAAAALCSMLVLSACNPHPGQAAYVGSDSISTDQLQGVLSRSLTHTDCGKSYAGQPVVLERVKLSDLILQRLLQQVADRLGITVSDADVQSALRDQSDVYGGQQLIELQASRNAAVSSTDLSSNVRTSVLEQKIEDRLTQGIQTSDQELQQFYQQHVSQYLFGHARDMVVTDKQTADAIVQLVKASPDSFGQLLAKQAADQQAKGLHPDPQTSSDLGPFEGLNPQRVVDRGGYIGRIPLAQLSQAGYHTDPGSVFAIQLSNGWNVVQIIDQQTFSDVKDKVRRDMLSQQRQQALDKALTEQVRTTPVHVNPRYGRWDPQQHVVVATAGGPVSQGQQPRTQLQCGQGQGQG